MGTVKLEWVAQAFPRLPVRARLCPGWETDCPPVKPSVCSASIYLLQLILRTHLKKEREKEILDSTEKKIFITFLKVMLMTFKAQCNMTFIFILTLRKCTFSVYKAELFFYFCPSLSCFFVFFLNVTFILICRGQASGLKVVIVKIIYENFSFFVIGN